MNLFYTPPDQVTDQTLTITDEEARHAEKVLRYRAGDAIRVADGAGNTYEGRISFIGNKTLQVDILQKQSVPRPNDLVLILGLIRNRQRLEYAIEKAVELGATEIALFKSDHSERGKVNLSRLQAIGLSAMKQSLRPYLPPIHYYDSLAETLRKYSDHALVAAHEKIKIDIPAPFTREKHYAALIGPEGGFSESEVQIMGKAKAELISLGTYRLRSETAVTALLSRFL